MNALTLSPWQVRLLYSLLTLLVLWLVRRLAFGWIQRREPDPVTRHRWRRTVTYVLGLILALVMMRIWLVESASLATYLGLLSAGIAIALQEPLASLVAWLLILLRRPFEIGDRIQVGEHAGDVLDIRMFQFVMLEIGEWVDADQSTGRLVYLPNRMVFSAPLKNYTRGFPFIWDELAVTVTFESDWRRAQALLEDVAARVAAPFGQGIEQALIAFADRLPVQYRATTPAVYLTVEESGVKFTLRYLCRPRERRQARHALWQALLEAIEAEEGVELAYPTLRVVR